MFIFQFENKIATIFFCCTVDDQLVLSLIPGLILLPKSSYRAWFFRGFWKLMPIGSYVEVSSGGDQDILSFYSTTASSTWKDPCRASSYKPIKEIETGYSKNSVARYQISSERRPKLTTTYRHAVHENLSRIMSAGIAFVIIWSLRRLLCTYKNCFRIPCRPTPKTNIQRNQFWWRISHVRPVGAGFSFR